MVTLNEITIGSYEDLPPKTFRIDVSSREMRAFKSGLSNSTTP